MNDKDRNDLIKTSSELHNLIETSYLKHPATKEDSEWLEKQRILLADMAIHLLQTAVMPGDFDIYKLKNNLHAILTISDQFLPQADLKKATEKIWES